jgi:two-component system chemotaxis response regulator CheB
MICDDSLTYVRALSQFLSHGGDLKVVGTCGTGEQLLALLALRTADLLIVDLELPGISGQQVIEEVTRSAHPIPVIAVSGHAGRGSEAAAAALAAGALEALPKAQIRLDDPDGPAAVALRHRVRRLARTRAPRDPERPSPAPGTLIHKSAAVVAICASTGGPSALASLLADLPADFPVPVLVVQHMAEGFIEGLVRWIAPRARLPVAVAEDGMALEPGVWFAPDDAHLILGPAKRLALDRVTQSGVHRPSADMLLSSVATTLGAEGVGVVLTGMGRDGGKGVAALCAAGGRVIAQDEETSVVFGMPRTAIERGASVVLPLPEIARALCQLRVPEPVG